MNAEQRAALIGTEGVRRAAEIAASIPSPDVAQVAALRAGFGSSLQDLAAQQLAGRSRGRKAAARARTGTAA